MRLFIAVDFPEKTKEEIGQLVTFLRKEFPQVAWTKKENIHLTIKFLGNIYHKRKALSVKRKVGEETLEKIKQEIKKAIDGVRPFELVFDKVGFFAREQLIIWLGAKNHSSLATLIKNLDRQMRNLGFKKEKREFTPHITIGRGKRLDSDILEKIKHRIISSEFILPKAFIVSEITLIESKLTPKGPIYKKVRSFSLRTSG